MQKSFKKLSTALVAVATLVGTALVAGPASADSAANAALTAAYASVVRTPNSSHVVSVNAGDQISVSFYASIRSDSIPSTSGKSIVFDPHLTSVTGSPSVFNQATSVYSNQSLTNSSNSSGAAVNTTSVSSMNWLNVSFTYDASFTSAGSFSINPSLTIDGATKDLTSTSVVDTVPTNYIHVYRNTFGSGPAGGAAKATTSAIDSGVTFGLPTVCVDKNAIAGGDTLQLVVKVNNGTTDSSANIDRLRWSIYDNTNGSSTGGSASNPWTIDSVPSTSSVVVGVNATASVSSSSAKTYTLKSISVFKNGESTNLVTDCGAFPSGKTIAVAQSGSILTATITPTVTDSTQFECAVYASSDSSHSIPLSSGQGFAMPGNPNAGCYMPAPSTAGTYVVGLRTYGTSTNEGLTTEQYLTGVAVKKAPTVPTLTTKTIKKTKTVTFSFTKGTTAKAYNNSTQKLLTSMTVRQNGPGTYCSISAVKSGGKVTGYTVKGLAAGMCMGVVTITGNSTYANSGTMVQIIVTN